MNDKTLQDHIEALDVELYMMRLAKIGNDLAVVEHHANRVITLAGEIRRECFLAQHKSGEGVVR